ncbi:hypothetical protein [uncultured Pelagimonas sp.]|uniref:hypothetical protein n=1 Tax=uncultured Pelagimonas sp. TaxID=1618102 RepID=UPI002605474C|nr:hypothetical protein [uncultured Pelagimonas sp.]
MKYAGKIALLVVVIGALAMGLMLLGARAGLWEPITGFGLYRTFFNPLAMIVAAVGLFAVIVHALRKEKRGIISGGVAVVFGALCLVPLGMGTINPQKRAAPIHDISTDTTNPPLFETLDDTRSGAKNTLVYAGPKLAAAQAAAYPISPRCTRTWPLTPLINAL